MPNWSGILEEIQKSPRKDALDSIREKYLLKLSEHTNRNTIAYYSGWLQFPSLQRTAVSDEDKNAFMSVIHGLDRAKGLDLILHTPGGDIAATESLVDYLHRMFGNNIRVIVPQIAMSAGTMIACASKEIIMGKQSSLGPIDPQFGGIPTHGVIEEFERAKKEIAADPQTIPVWQSILNKYHPTFVGECQKAIEWSEIMVKEWLTRNMLSKNLDKVDSVVKFLSDHDSQKTHSRHINIDQCTAAGLNITLMEDDDILQDLVLSVHHAFMHTFSNANSPVVKIVENQTGQRMIFFSDI